MGFEIKYFYKEAKKDFPGSYDEEVLSKTSKIGKFDEEIPLENLAGKIMAQLARRNILIVDIEIFEYTKKKISYKETETGILIKNKKFSFDSGAIVESDSSEDEELSRVLEDKELLEKIKSHIAPSKVGNSCSKNSCSIKTEPSSKRILRQEIYDPELTSKHKVEQKGYRFTVGKKYPIFLEKSLIGGIINYLTKDDSGREVEVPADCFVVPPVGLSFEDEGPKYFGASDSSDVDLWKNVRTEDAMPDIRRK